MHKKLSIVIPTFNYAHTLTRAVDSVAMQLDNTIELIVINDGSTDNTAAVLDALKTKYTDKLIVFSKENGGLAATRNFGIAKASAEYLVFLDADDELYPDAILNISSHITQNPGSQFILGGHYSVATNGKKKLHLPGALPASTYNKLQTYLIDKSISISNGACVMHKSIFENYHYPEHFRNSEDISMFAYTLANFTCTTINFPLASIYKHDDSLRHNASYAENVGLQLVDEVFHPSRIPAELQALKKPFLAQRLLSLSRVCHENNRHLRCAQFFKQAFKANWRVIFKWTYFKKFIISFVRTTMQKQ
jgi:glycosyltransferase involved in cell wall biosynthesis